MCIVHLPRLKEFNLESGHKCVCVCVCVCVRPSVSAMSLIAVTRRTPGLCWSVWMEPCVVCVCVVCEIESETDLHLHPLINVVKQPGHLSIPPVCVYPVHKHAFTDLLLVWSSTITAYIRQDILLVRLVSFFIIYSPSFDLKPVWDVCLL